MISQKRAAMYARWQAANPNPASELHYNTPFQLLISVILSAQSTDVGVNKATPDLFTAAPDAAAMAALSEDEIAQYIKTLGLYKNKAAFLAQTSRMLLELHGGEVPRSRTALEALPGVGRKTANVVLNVAFGEPTIAVDTHIFRVSNRTGIAPGKTPREVEDALLKYTPQPYLLHAHHWLILHGRYVCKALRPECHCCLVYEGCEWSDKPRSGKVRE